MRSFVSAVTAAGYRCMLHLLLLLLLLWKLWENQPQKVALSWQQQQQQQQQ
jgi:hypothetical protein